MNGMGPGKLVTGLSLAARENMANKAAQKAYNARAEARRSGEGLNAEEAARAAASAREAKTLNPMAWMAGPKGMKENFKQGGQVKKMASGGKVSASSRGDGIAMRGKTRGMMR
jgi:FKBP-type peptidyl-prolyl cis-trans isomerase